MPDTPRQWHKGAFPFRLEVLTPVFIGSGTTLSPLEYVIRKEGGVCRLHLIDLRAWLMEHADDASVQSVVGSGNMESIRRMLDDRVDAARFGLCSSPLDASLADELGKALEGVSRGASGKNRTGDVDAALRSPLNLCLMLPGSSLKGAMSTPLINILDKMRQPGQPSLKEASERKDMQRRLTAMFGNIREHAMQALKVSDVLAPDSACSIVRAKEQGFKPDKPGTPKRPCEAIMPGCGDMWGRLLLDGGRSKVPGITLPGGDVVSREELVTLCNAFYKNRFQEEMGKFYSRPHFARTRAALEPMEQKIAAALKTGSMLLRVGHYCHVESVTVENRQPQTRKDKNGRSLPWGTTRTLANGVFPFGWVLLHFCDPEDYAHGLRESEAAQNASFAARQARLAELDREAADKAAQAAARQRQQEEARRAAEEREKEEQRAREERERRKASLSPEEARLLDLESDPKNEALSMEIYKDMKTWTPEMQRKAAAALKGCWQGMGKWTGKQSPKQKEKIKALKTLLGE